MATGRRRRFPRSRVPRDTRAAMTYACAFCGEDNDTFVDPGGGARQIYTEDCAVCCRPNLVTVTLDADGDAHLHVTQEYEA
jgi:cysteine-rich CPXCG protein